MTGSTNDNAAPSSSPQTEAAGGLVFGSVCSGIEAASVAWKPLGWKCAFMSEIEAFPRSVLAHHYPETPLHGDFTTIKAGEYEPIDLLVGGTPCQSFSVAGLRGGLDDDRGNLALEYLRLAGRLRPRWLVWENVPGVFSATSHDAPDLRPPSIDLDAGDGPEDGEEVVVEDEYDADESHAFSCILAGFSELGYGFAYRVFDAQFFGVAQRRRRVFVVGYLGDWRRAAAVLFERHSLSGNPAPRREAGKGVTPVFGAGSCGRNDAGIGRPDAPAFNLDTGGAQAVAYAIQERAVCENPDAGPDGAGFRDDDAAYTIEARPVPQAVAFALRGRTGGAMPEVEGDGDRAGALRSASGGSSRDYVAFPINPNALRGDTQAKTPSRDAAGVMRLRDPGLGIGADGDPADTLQAAGPGAVGTSSAVRRLTPRECDRLQGFEDDYTLVLHRGKPAADGPRYKALGNSMAVPVMAHIGRRIAVVDAIAASRLERAA